MLVERGSFLSAEPKGREGWTGPTDELSDQSAADATPTSSGLHVDMPNPPDRSLSLVRIDVETAKADEGTIEVGEERDLARPIETVPAGFPLGDEAADEPEAFVEADFDESGDL